MTSRLIKLTILMAVLSGSSIAAYSQSSLPDASSRTPGSSRDDSSFGLKEMIAKQRSARDKRDYDEMLARGDEALRLAKQLELSYEQNKTFSQQDRSRLESLEKVVTKIRKELGGDDDGSDDSSDYMKSEDEPKPSTMEEAFRFLQSTTVKLVDELKKTTRFSISALAIQSSNTVIKLVRFLRLRK